MRRLALRTGFVDEPGHRKIHTRPIALGGGSVIFCVTIVPLAVICAIVRWAPESFLPQGLVVHVQGLLNRTPQVLVLIGAAALLHATGLVDDKRHLGPLVKLAVQVVVAIAMATLGEIRFDFFISNLPVTTVLSVLWIVVIINAFNFLDNMDGLSAGTACVCAAIILSAALRSGQVFVAGLLVLLIGALLGFLVFNFPPAKIFMGDAGSLLVGMLLAVTTIRTTYYHEDSASGAWSATLTPLVVLAVPLYDFVSVTLLRLLAHKSPFIGDTRHFSHRLVKRGMTQTQAVLTIYLATACTGLAALFLHQVSRIGTVIVLAQTVLILLIIAILEYARPET